MPSPSLRISHAVDSLPKNPLVMNETMTHKVTSLVEEALHVVRSQRDRITARCFIRAALALIGEAVRGVDMNEEKDCAGEHLDESDFHDVVHNVEGLARKVKESVHERESLVAYLKSIHRQLGNGVGSGSLTPRPRDYAAAMSRFGEEALNSPSQQRGSTQMERLEHAHSMKRP